MYDNTVATFDTKYKVVNLKNINKILVEQEIKMK